MRWRFSEQKLIQAGLLCLGLAILIALLMILNDPQNLGAWMLAVGALTIIGVIGVITVPISRATRLLEEARELIALGKYQEALIQLDRAIQMSPRLAAAYLARSAAYRGVSQIDLAMDDAERAIRLAPRLPEARLTRARLYTYRGLYDDAIYDLRQGINQKPSWSDGYLELAQIQINIEDYESSLATLHDLSIYTNSDHTRYDSFIWTGWVYKEKLKDLDKAIATYTQAIPILPNRKIGYLHRAYAYRSRGDLYQAAEDLLRAAQRPPTLEDQGQYHWIRAECYAHRYTITKDERDLAAWIEALRMSIKEDKSPYNQQSRQWFDALVSNQFNNDTLTQAMSMPPEIRIFPN